MCLLAFFSIFQNSTRDLTKWTEFHLPEISCNRNRTSKNPQAYVLVCSIEWPNIVAILIDIAVMCLVILCPFGSIYWFWYTQISNDFGSIRLRDIALYELMVSVELTLVWRSFVLERKTHTPPVDWFTRSAIPSRCTIYECFYAGFIVITEIKTTREKKNTNISF